MRGLSPIVSTLVLLVAAVIGGVIAYNYFMKTVGSITNKPTLVVENAEIVQSSSSQSYIALTITNLSPTSFRIDGITIYCGNTVKKFNYGTNMTIEAGGRWIPAAVSGKPGIWSGVIKVWKSGTISAALPPSCTRATLALMYQGSIYTISFPLTYSS